MLTVNDLKTDPKYQVMPDLSAEEYEALKTDIAQRGIQVAIESDEEGNILDGYHRYQIWCELHSEGVDVPEPPIRVREGLTEDEKLEHAYKLNTHRRHLSQEWKKEQALQLRQHGWTQQRISDVLGVPQQTLSRWFGEFTQMGKLDASLRVTGRDGKQYPVTKLPSDDDTSHDDTSHDDAALSFFSEETVPSDGIEMILVEDITEDATIAPDEESTRDEPPPVSELLTFEPGDEPTTIHDTGNEDMPEDDDGTDETASSESLADTNAAMSEVISNAKDNQAMTSDIPDLTKVQRLGPTIEAHTDNGNKVYVVTGEADHPVFNQETSNAIGWCGWTWNSVTGCLGPCANGVCDYCYAQGIAQRLYTNLPEDIRFAPMFHPERLAAPHNTKIPEKMAGKPTANKVFVSSMGDLFGEWVPQAWIDAVLQVVTDSPQWTYLFLTKNPKRMVEVHWPANAWVGTTVDVQTRVRPAEEAFSQIQASVKFVSCEPLLEPVTFTSLDTFDWIIIGARSKTPTQPEFQPQPQWVIDLWKQAIDARCKVYFKANLSIIKQHPDSVDHKRIEW